MRRSTFTALVTLVALGGAPAAAQGAGDPIIADCQDGRIDGTYSQKQYARTLRNIPTDVDEYTDCRSVVQRARLGAAGGGGTARPAEAGAVGGGAAGASAAAGGGPSAEELLSTASPQERRAVAEAKRAGGTAPVAIGGRAVSPDTAGLSPAGAANVVPTPLVIALVLLAAALVLGATQTIRTRVLARRTPAA